MRLWRTQIFMPCGVAFLFCLCYNLERWKVVSKMDEVMYCEKCGHVGHIVFSKKCKNCGTKMKLLPEELKYKYHIFVEDWAQTSDEEELLRKENFVMGELKDNSLFSMEDYQIQVQKKIKINQRLNDYEKRKLLEQQAKNLARMQKENDKQNCIPKCPICGSTNIDKITVGSRAVKTAIFGVVGAVDDAGKTYKCGNCGSKF